MPSYNLLVLVGVIMRQCTVPFCDKYTPRTKDRFCSSHRNEFFIRKISPYKELPPLWAFRKCKVHDWQRFEDFYYHKSSNSYYCRPCTLSKLKSQYCPIKRKEKQIREWHQQRNYRIKKQFNITSEDFNNLLKQQNHQCAICKNNNPEQHFDIDHCHKTGKVRGLLCRSCNMGLGYFKDSPSLLNKAADYLYRFV